MVSFAQKTSSIISKRSKKANNDPEPSPGLLQSREKPILLLGSQRDVHLRFSLPGSYPLLSERDFSRLVSLAPVGETERAQARGDRLWLEEPS